MGQVCPCGNGRNAFHGQKTCAQKPGGGTFRGVVKVRAGHAPVGRNTGHLNKEMSWTRAAGVRLEGGLEAGCRSLPGLSAACQGPASNTSSGRVPPQTTETWRNPGTTRNGSRWGRSSALPQRALNQKSKNAVPQGYWEAQLLAASEDAFRTCLFLALSSSARFWSEWEAHW